MINLYNENHFFSEMIIGDPFRPTLFFYMIIFEGSIVLELNGIENIYEKGSVVVFSPNILYKIKHLEKATKFRVVVVDRSQVSEKFNFNFNRYEAYRMANAILIGNFQPYTGKEFSAIMQLVEQMDFYSTKPKEFPFKQDILLSLLVTIVYIVSGKTLENNQGKATVNSRKDDITIRFIELLSSHYKKEKKLKFYADELLISVKYLSNCVREITNAPPTKFIDDALINEAKIMLLNSKITINMIADELGFSDQYVFGKFFKRHTGLSPRSFKSQNKSATIF